MWSLLGKSWIEVSLIKEEKNSKEGLALFPYFSTSVIVDNKKHSLGFDSYHVLVVASIEDSSKIPQNIYYTVYHGQK